MGLISKLRRGRPPSYRAEAIALHASGMVGVVGESHRQEVLQRLAPHTTDCTPYIDELGGYPLRKARKDTRLRWFRAALVREPENKHDRNAIAVYADTVGRVGYLSRDDAIDYQPVFEAVLRRGSTVAACPAYLIGGERGKPSYGVVLCLSSPERVIADLEATMPARSSFADRITWRWPDDVVFENRRPPTA